MRAIIDTNVLVSGLLWHGNPHALLAHVRAGTVTLISSPALLAEFTEVLARPEFDVILIRSNTSRERCLAEVQALAELTTPASLPAPSAATRMTMRCWRWHSPLRSISS